MKTKQKDALYCGVSQDKIDMADPVIDWENLNHFKTFVIERYRIHKRKDVMKLPAPWTKNPVLKEFKFTNVRREHDKQTRYLIENIVNNPELSLEDKIVNCFMFRAWNNWDTLKDFGFPYSAKILYKSSTKESVRALYNKLQIADPGRLWWSNAYNQGGTKAAWKFEDMDGYQKSLKGLKATYEEEIPLRPFHVGVWLGKNNIVEKILKSKDQKECFEVIKSIKGFSDFLAYQVFVDLTYIKDFLFSENEFVVAGPGCKRGLDLIFTDADGMTYEEQMFWLRDQINMIEEGLSGLFNLKELGGKIEYNPRRLFSDLSKYDRRMNVMSIENCMCELSKYVKAVNGTGRPKNKYKGGKA